MIVNIALQIKHYWGLLVEKEFIPQQKMAFCQLLIACKDFKQNQVTHVCNVPVRLNVCNTVICVILKVGDI